ncbi:MAG: phosphoribosylglycinamide formyltransferase [Thermoleophilia bacterium]|nr:phosphoribosylglycinamide formyltransferase [Thermoleophilia bacterium]
MSGGEDRSPEEKFRLGVLISGSGSNLQSIIDRLHQGPGNIEIAVVISDNPGAYGLKRAEKAGIPTAVYPMSGYSSRAAHDLDMAEELARRGVDLVVLAGYMLIVTSEFLQRFPHRVINLHPSLLPAFPGGTPIEDTMAYGARVTGVTVHFVDEGTDTGPIILQEAVDIKYNDTVESLRERIHKVEHRLLPDAVQLIASGRAGFASENPRRVIIESD